MDLSPKSRVEVLLEVAAYCEIRAEREALATPLAGEKCQHDGSAIVERGRVTCLLCGESADVTPPNADGGAGE
jgi:hypothetical protein